MDARRAMAALAWAAAVGSGAGCGQAAPVVAAPASDPAESAGVAGARVDLAEGRRTFRLDTFGDEAFWGGTLRLHHAIEGAARGGVGAGVSPRAALGVGLKVDLDALDGGTRDALRRGAVDLDSPETTLALLARDAVVGVRAFPDGKGGLRSLGITCALCHSTVDDALAPGIGHRLDGRPNQDLDVGAIVGLSPDLSAVARLLSADEATVRSVLSSWGRAASTRSCSWTASPSGPTARPRPRSSHPRTAWPG